MKLAACGTSHAMSHGVWVTQRRKYRSRYNHTHPTVCGLPITYKGHTASDYFKNEPEKAPAGVKAKPRGATRC